MKTIGGRQEINEKSPLGGAILCIAVWGMLLFGISQSTTECIYAGGTRSKINFLCGDWFWWGAGIYAFLGISSTAGLLYVFWHILGKKKA